MTIIFTKQAWSSTNTNFLCYSISNEKVADPDASGIHNTERPPYPKPNFI